MFPLKKLAADAIAHAFERAEHYRLLNQPWAAESICLDILEAQPGHQDSLRVLLLARTDQFGGETPGIVEKAREVLAQLTGEYERLYYAGIIAERRAIAKLNQRAPGAGFVAYEWIREAMVWYEKAGAIRPPGDDDAVLRWNTCARLLANSPHIVPRGDDTVEPVIGE